MQAKMLPCPRCGTMLQEQDALAVKSGSQQCPKKRNLDDRSSHGWGSFDPMSEDETVSMMDSINLRALTNRQGSLKPLAKNFIEIGYDIGNPPPGAERPQREAYSGMSRVSAADEVWIQESIMAYSNSI